MARSKGGSWLSGAVRGASWLSGVVSRGSWLRARQDAEQLKQDAERSLHRQCTSPLVGSG